MKALNQETVVGTALESIFQHLAEKLAAASRDAVTTDEVMLVIAPPHTGCDLSFQCFQLARQWKTNPAQIAQQMAADITADTETNDLLAALEPAGPYLNLKLARSAVARKLFAEIADKGEGFGHCQRQGKEVVMMEYVSPNTNKPLHLGHLRNALLGRAVTQLIEAQGARVIKSDIINDRGIHITKSMLAYQRWGGGATPESKGVKGDHFVGQLYVEFDKALKAEKDAWLATEGIDPGTLDEKTKKETDERFNQASELLGAARDMLRRWEEGDTEVRELWRMMNSWVYEGFGATYGALGITFDKHFYESEIYQEGKEIILDALERGIFEKAPNGAVIAPLSKHGKLQDKTVLRGDGTGLYITQDINLATIKFREFGLTQSIYCIAYEQDFYMKQLFATLDLLGFPWAKGLFHLSYGMVYLPEGKMKSREGKVVDVDELLAELTNLAAEELRRRYADLGDDEIAQRAPAIARAAVVFHFLIVGRESDLQFDPRESVAFEGKTGPYLQYSYARVASILRKAEGSWSMPDEPVLDEDLEGRLLTQLLLFPSVVTDAAESYDPSRLAAYLADLAAIFSTFYHDHPVLKADEPIRSSRLALVDAFRTTMGNGLRLLAIEPLEEM